MVTFGNAHRVRAARCAAELSKRGSLSLTRPTLFHYTATREELVAGANELFAVITAGAVRVHIGQTYALREAAQAHRDLEARANYRVDGTFAVKQGAPAEPQAP